MVKVVTYFNAVFITHYLICQSILFQSQVRCSHVQKIWRTRHRQNAGGAEKHARLASRGNSIGSTQVHGSPPISLLFMFIKSTDVQSNDKPTVCSRSSRRSPSRRRITGMISQGGCSFKGNAYISYTHIRYFINHG